jgi:hypothetical protein
MESLQSCGWPYISLRIIDLREGDGAIDLTNWPTDKQGRPRCMHVASLAHYYGLEIAASRQALLLFKEIVVQAIRGLSSAVRLLDDLFQSLWTPQTISYVRHQVSRHINQSYRSRAGTISEALGSLEEDQATLQAWASSGRLLTRLLDELRTMISRQSRSREWLASFSNTALLGKIVARSQ